MSEFLGHAHTKKDLDRLIQSSPHAIGIQGESGSGKKYMSELIVQKILNLTDISTYPYVKSLDCSKSVGIDDIRALIKFLALRIPGEGKYRRCLIFWSYEKLGHEAQNALSKSFEEPPEDTLMVITTESKADILPTTVSRLSWLNIRPLSLDDASAYFSGQHSKEQIQRAYMLSSGLPGMLIKLLENYDEHSLVESINQAKDFLKKDRMDRIVLVEKLLKDKDFDQNLFLSSLAKILEAALLSGLNRKDEVNPKILADLKKILKTQNAQKYNANQKLVLTELMYNL